MAPKKTRRRFSKADKLAAVKRVIEGGEAGSAVAADLGVVRSLLYGWVKAARAELPPTRQKPPLMRPKPPQEHFSNGSAELVQTALGGKSRAPYRGETHRLKEQNALLRQLVMNLLSER